MHSGSDKFSVYPLLVSYWGERIHVKTAGTSYLEALRVLAGFEPDLFLKIYEPGREYYQTDRRTYHVSARLDLLPAAQDLPALLDDFHAREVLHVTYGMALQKYGKAIRAALAKYADAYQTDLERHFQKHLALLA